VKDLRSQEMKTSSTPGTFKTRPFEGISKSPTDMRSVRHIAVSSLPETPLVRATRPYSAQLRRTLTSSVPKTKDTPEPVPLKFADPLRIAQLATTRHDPLSNVTPIEPPPCPMPPQRDIVSVLNSAGPADVHEAVTLTTRLLRMTLCESGPRTIAAPSSCCARIPSSGTGDIDYLTRFPNRAGRNSLLRFQEATGLSFCVFVLNHHMEIIGMLGLSSGKFSNVCSQWNLHA
jgi:hypothetical protein